MRLGARFSAMGVDVPLTSAVRTIRRVTFNVSINRVWDPSPAQGELAAPSSVEMPHAEGGWSVAMPAHARYPAPTRPALKPLNAFILPVNRDAAVRLPLGAANVSRMPVSRSEIRGHNSPGPFGIRSPFDPAQDPARVLWLVYERSG